jgi:hypothetical protein
VPALLFLLHDGVSILRERSQRNAIMDAELGLVYLRVPTWASFRLQFYCNGHSWLARQLTAASIGFISADNAFVRINGWHRAQELADGFSPDVLHRVNPCLFASRPRCGAKWRDRYAAQCCPVLEVFGQTCHWSLMQVDFATDLVFRSAATLGPLYEQLARQSVLSVKAEQIATFLGRQITPQLAQELGSQFSTRIEGTYIKHRFGDASMTCVRYCSAATAVIWSICLLSTTSPLDARALDRLTKPRKVEDKTVKGINFFDPIDSTLLHALPDPRVNIAGIRRADLRALVEQLSPARLSRQLRRLRDLGVIKRVAGTYRYYLTRIGRSATAALCHVTQSVLIPVLI